MRILFQDLSFDLWKLGVHLRHSKFEPLGIEYLASVALANGHEVKIIFPGSTISEVKKEVNHLMDEVGKNGGYILAPCHNIQPDTPIENVLAIYEAVAERR